MLLMLLLLLLRLLLVWEEEMRLGGAIGLPKGGHGYLSLSRRSLRWQQADTAGRRW